MVEDFKKKLRNYAEGKLSPEEKAEVEEELAKMEVYQEFLEEDLGDDCPRRIPENPEGTDMSINKREAQIIKKAKWKARIHNAFTALAIIFLGSVLCGIFTSIYFTSGNPNRLAVYRDVAESTIAITEPNIQLRGGGTSINPFFTMDLKGELRKKIGSKEVNAGEIEISFVLNQAGFPVRERLIDAADIWPFRYPNTSIGPMNRDWEKLEKLPEGTVAEAYLSFDQLYTTDEVLKRFREKDMRPVWFAVDTGFDDITAQYRASLVGFPYEPMWHHDDMTVTSRKEEKKGLFMSTVSESANSPMIEAYGSAELRNENFLKTLELLKNHEKVANRIAFGGDLRLTERIQYLETHGVKIYGIVVTGPSKEILRLKNESWIAGIYLGEVRLWNWEPPL